MEIKFVHYGIMEKKNSIFDGPTFIFTLLIITAPEEILTPRYIICISRIIIITSMLMELFTRISTINKFQNFKSTSLNINFMRAWVKN